MSSVFDFGSPKRKGKSPISSPNRPSPSGHHNSSRSPGNTRGSPSLRTQYNSLSSPNGSSSDNLLYADRFIPSRLSSKLDEVSIIQLKITKTLHKNIQILILILIIFNTY